MSRSIKSRRRLNIAYLERRKEKVLRRIDKLKRQGAELLTAIDALRKQGEN